MMMSKDGLHSHQLNMEIELKHEMTSYYLLALK